MIKKPLIEGINQPRFEPVREAFASLWNEIEVGAGLSVFLGDELVVDHSIGRLLQLTQTGGVG